MLASGYGGPGYLLRACRRCRGDLAWDRWLAWLCLHCGHAMTASGQRQRLHIERYRYGERESRRVKLRPVLVHAGRRRKGRQLAEAVNADDCPVRVHIRVIVRTTFWKSFLAFP